MSRQAAHAFVMPRTLLGPWVPDGGPTPAPRRCARRFGPLGVLRTERNTKGACQCLHRTLWAFHRPERSTGCLLLWQTEKRNSVLYPGGKLGVGEGGRAGDCSHGEGQDWVDGCCGGDSASLCPVNHCLAMRSDATPAVRGCHQRPIWRSRNCAVSFSRPEGPRSMLVQRC